MKVIFFYQRFENLGIEYLSACLKKYGHQTSLIFDPQLFINYTLPNKALSKALNFRENLLEETVRARPGLVCFSCASDQFGWALQLAEAVKKILNVPIVFGGPHPTAVPENVIKHKCIDFVIVGEGEESLVELVNSLEDGKDVTNIRNLWCRVNDRPISNPLRPLISDLDSLPFPDKDLYYIDRKEFFNTFHGFNNTYAVMGSRGCPKTCSYCQNSYLKKLYKGSKYLRYRSAPNIIRELAIAKQKYGVKTIVFWDDILTYNKEWLRELLERYKKEICLPFTCFSYPDRIDKETIALLEDAGCRVMNFGFQSISENIRKNVLLRYDSNDDIIKAITLISRSRILLFADLIVGLPTETVEDLLNTAEFFNKNKVNLINIYWLRYLPKTEITKYIENKEFLNEINEGVIYGPFQAGGSSFDKDKAKLAYLIIIANFIPRSIFKFLLKTKLYRFFSSKNPYYMVVSLSLALTNMVFRKKYIIPQLPVFLSFLRYHKYYISKFLSEKLRRLAGKSLAHS
ncbi:MAG: radical SAM protein [Candidatus Omnitrophica bacterium]|jgi:radical SAM superfamily enzyme YgiQ (UPF0313 family)|nr:radical SAM protein [Candidatus Omnitrophota bacterium]